MLKLPENILFIFLSWIVLSFTCYKCWHMWYFSIQSSYVSLLSTSCFYTLHSWCKKWRVLINKDKPKCVHFRKNRAKPSEFVFTIGNNVLQTVDLWKDIGMIFEDRGSFEHNCETLAKVAGHALGKIISKIHTSKKSGLNHSLSCMTLVWRLYWITVWREKPCQSIDNVQHRAMRYIIS